MTHVTPYVRYLAIPRGYPFTDDLRWSENGEAIEYVGGTTFVVAGALPAFLEGFAAQRPLIHFSYLLHLLRLILEPRVPNHGFTLRHQMLVRDAFQSGGRQLRNAGAFCARLTREVSPAWIAGTSSGLVQWFASYPVYPPLAGWTNPETPYLDAASFQLLVADSLGQMSDVEIHHWMRFGQPPVAEEGRRLAEEIIVAKPPANQGVLDDVLRKRPRLAGALPLVGTMVSALTLPPRRRTPPELPIGGYADVTTRGDPAQLLPSQFALDPDEFVRRFAEKELLFFRREEPHRRTREQLVLLVDQGVRTWGPVRLALSAAVLAFRRLAGKHKTPFFIRFGSSPGQRVDPSTDWELLADRLEASDLSAVPTTLLDSEMGEDADESDLILLTHPRTLLEKDVRSSVGYLPKCKRCFALTVDETGAAQFSELRGGESTPVSRFRVDFSATVPEPVGTQVEMQRWSGDVEPIPCPFSVGPFQKITAVGFDQESTHMLVAANRGYLHLFRTADGQVEMLPRAMYRGSVLHYPQAIVGMRGGIVVGGLLNTTIIAAHYDFTHKKVKVHSLGNPGNGAMRWYAFPETNSIAMRMVGICRGLDLTTGAMYAEPEQPPSVNPRAHNAYLQALLRELPAPIVPVAVDKYATGKTENLPLPYLEHNRETGRIALHSEGGSKGVLPHADGAPLFCGDIITVAQSAGQWLAIRTQRRSKQGVCLDWFLISIDDAQSLFEIPAVYSDESLNRLSPDGQFFARFLTQSQIMVCRLGSQLTALTTAPGRVHNQLSVQLKRFGLNIIIGAKQHALNWREGPLDHRYFRVRKDETLDQDTAIEHHSTHPFFSYDPTRFYAYASKQVDAVLDATGQVVIFDPHRHRVACIFAIWRDELAAWLPDGTRYGPERLTGGPAAPNALARIGEALREAGGVLAS